MTANSVYKPSEKSTTKNLDIWLKELSDKVTVLSAKIVILANANTEKDATIGRKVKKHSKRQR